MTLTRSSLISSRSSISALHPIRPFMVAARMKSAHLMEANIYLSTREQYVLFAKFARSGRTGVA